VDWETIVRVRDRNVCITTVDLVTREAWIVAKVLGSRHAVSTRAANMPKPGDTDAFANLKTLNAITQCDNVPYDFVTRNDR
jgi:uncharacterized protein YjhX (UPF0386 family)